MKANKSRIFLVACFCVGMAQADVVFTTGNHPQPGEANVLLNSGGFGMTVTGTTNSLPGVVVDFTSTELELEPSSGQARVSGDPEHTPLTDMTISLAGGATYSDLIFNPFIGGCHACVKGGTGTVTVDALDSHGVAEMPSVFTYTIGNGNNFLTITTTNGEKIVSTQIQDAGGSFDDLRQPRISGFGATPVPEPSNYVPIMGLALGAIALLRRSGKRYSIPS